MHAIAVVLVLGGFFGLGVFYATWLDHRRRSRLLKRSYNAPPLREVEIQDWSDFLRANVGPSAFGIPPGSFFGGDTPEENRFNNEFLIGVDPGISDYSDYRERLKAVPHDEFEKLYMGTWVNEPEKETKVSDDRPYPMTPEEARKLIKRSMEDYRLRHGPITFTPKPRVPAEHLKKDDDVPEDGASHPDAGNPETPS